MLDLGIEKSPLVLEHQTDSVGINFKDSIPQHAGVKQNHRGLDSFFGTVRAFRRHIQGNLAGRNSN